MQQQLQQLLHDAGGCARIGAGIRSVAQARTTHVRRGATARLRVDKRQMHRGLDGGGVRAC